MKLWPGVITEKVIESRDFYCRVFGARVIYEGEGGWFVLLQIGEAELGFMRPGLESQAPLFRPAFQGQGVWMAVEVDDVDAEHRRIQALGVSLAVDLRDEPWGDRHFALVDPNGVSVDVVQRR